MKPRSAIKINLLSGSFVQVAERAAGLLLGVFEEHFDFNVLHAQIGSQSLLRQDSIRRLIASRLSRVVSSSYDFDAQKIITTQ